MELEYHSKTSGEVENITSEDYKFFWDNLRYHELEQSQYMDYCTCALDIINEDEDLANIKSEIGELITLWKQGLSKVKLETPIRITSLDINNKLNGKRVEFKGMVYRISSIFEEIYSDIYYCPDCGEDFVTNHNDFPKECGLCSTRGKFKKKGEKTRDFIEMDIEEIPDEITKQPDRIKCKIYTPLVYSDEVKRLQPGEVINVIGTISKEKLKIKNGSEVMEYLILADTINFENEKDGIKEFTEDDNIKIQAISKDKPLERLANSLAPNIFDMVSIKKAAVLQMVRGMENHPLFRAPIHILLVGEAGVAKSQIVRQAHKKTPRSIYGSGDNMSAAGLGTSMEKDETSGRWAARAGILCRANRSVVSIDEFDKLKKEDQAPLHTAMEHGETISTKAGNHLTLKADCSIFAACNPKNGTFLDLSGYESISSQVNIPIPILNRFDLIFMVRDDVDDEKDRKISRSMWKDNSIQEIDTDLFKKYIYFASQIQPTASEEIQSQLEEIYSKLRQSSKTSRETKINPRTLRAITSLAVASAKIRLSSEVTIEDINIAEGLIMDSFQSMGFGRSLTALDQASLYTNTTSKKILARTKIRELIKEHIIQCKKDNIKADWDKIKPSLQELGYSERELNSVFSQLKQEGVIMGEDYKLVWASL